MGTDVPPELRGWSIRHSQYRQLFNPHLFLLFVDHGRIYSNHGRIYSNHGRIYSNHGGIYSNHGAMTPGACGETADGMSLAKIGRIIDALRHERYRFQPVKRVWVQLF